MQPRTRSRTASSAEIRCQILEYLTQAGFAVALAQRRERGR